MVQARRGVSIAKIRRMRIISFLTAVIIISCSGGDFNVEGKILNIKKGNEIGKFNYIDLKVEGKEVRFFSNNKDFKHYTFDHLISHQISGDTIKIYFEKKSDKNIILNIENHDHSH